MMALFQERLNLLPTICGQQSNFDTVLCIDRWSLNLIKSQFTPKRYSNGTVVIFPPFSLFSFTIQSSSELDGTEMDKQHKGWHFWYSFVSKYHHYSSVPTQWVLSSHTVISDFQLLLHCEIFMALWVHVLLLRLDFERRRGLKQKSQITINVLYFI